MYTKEEAEGRRLKNPFDTITEGIGINRLTKNFMMAKLDGAYRGTDREAVEMSRYIICTIKNDAFWLTYVFTTDMCLIDLFYLSMRDITYF